MKKRFHSLTIVMVFGFLIITACSEEDAIRPFQPGQITLPPPLPTPPPPPSPPPSPPVDHVAPIAKAGNDTTVYTPFNTHTLNGSSSTGKEISYEWKIIKSPSNVEIMLHGAQGKPKRFVDGLVDVGIYEFELTVTDFYNLKSKDIVIVTVSEPNCNNANKEVIIKDLNWTQPWYTQLSITNLFSLVPTNSHIKSFYIKRDGSDQWELIEPYLNKNSANYSGKHTWEYVNYFDNNTWVLQIYPNSSFIDDTPDVEIEYCN
jgi:hypothetical protein